MTNLLLCGCEPHGHKCLISEGGCGRCFEHCVCTPSGVASTGAGRAEDTGSPGTPPFRPLAQSLAGLHCRVPGVVACPYRAALLQGVTMHECPDCQDTCDCDIEDTWNDDFDDCSHECQTLESDDFDDDFDEEC